MKSNYFGIEDIYKTYQVNFGKNREQEIEKELDRLNASTSYLYQRLQSYEISEKIVDKFYIYLLCQNN